jgi:hypothetical protein
MDLLDRIHPVARGLLDQVDATLVAAGAPPEHPIWPLLRRIGALPGELVAHLAAVAPDRLTEASDALHRQADGYRHRADAVPMPAAWAGPAADAFAVTWTGLSGHLSGSGPDTLAGRLTDTAAYLDDVKAWLTRGRRALAGTVAECLGSAEAVTLRSATPSTTAVATAAATVGAHLLQTAGEILDDGRALHDRWAGKLGELTYRPPTTIPTGPSHLRIG